MLEFKHKGILSLNLKKLANCVDDLKKKLILRNEMLLLMVFFISNVLKQRENLVNISMFKSVFSNKRKSW